MEYLRRPSFLVEWLVNMAVLAGALALAWMLSKAGLPNALLSVGWPLVFSILVGAALYVFFLPFRRHLPPLPRLPLPDWVLRKLGFVLVIVVAAFNLSLLFSRGAIGPIYLGILFAACTIGAFWKWRLDRTESKEAQAETSAGE